MLGNKLLLGRLVLLLRVWWGAAILLRRILHRHRLLWLHGLHLCLLAIGVGWRRVHGRLLDGRCCCTVTVKIDTEYH